MFPSPAAITLRRIFPLTGSTEKQSTVAPNDETHVSVWASLNASDRTAVPLKFSEKLRFYMRSLLHRSSSRAWCARIAEPDLAPLYPLSPRLAIKPLHRFVSNRWSVVERVKLLTTHYDSVRPLLSTDIAKAIYADGHDLLHILNTTTNRRLTFRLYHGTQFEREGELTLMLMDATTSLPLARLSFSIGRSAENKRLLYIGGIQACNDPRVRTIIHDIAKEMHGLRAKALVLWCVQQIAIQWNVQEIHAISDAHHVSSRRSRRHNFAANYDEFWSESDGTLRHDGFWEIPVQPRQRSRDELKPNRRKQYERRYAFLAELRTTLSVALDQCLPARFNRTPSVQNINANKNASAPVTTQEYVYASPVPAANAPAMEAVEAMPHSKIPQEPVSVAALC